MLLPVFFPLMWFGILMLLAKVGGWSKLAEHYTDREAAPTRTWGFRSARIGLVNYNGGLTFGVTHNGLMLRAFMLLRPGHPTLVIPWTDLTITQPEKPGWLIPSSKLSASRVPNVTILINDKLAAEIAAAKKEAGR